MLGLAWMLQASAVDRQRLWAADENATATSAASDAAADSDKLPPPLRAYKGRQIADTMHFQGAPWLMRDSREREEDCTLLLDALKLKPGQTVCDMGCGNGFYALKMARFVGDEGKIVCVDIQPEMLKMLEARAKDDQVRNVKLVLGGPADPRLGEATLDLVLLVDVYHEFSYPEQMLNAIHKSLRPGGRVALAEFRLEDRNVPIKLLHKMTKKQILKEFEPAGFRLVEQFDRLPWQHLMFFMRADDPAAQASPETGKTPPSKKASVDKN